MIRLTVNGDMVQFSSKLDIEPSLWDTKAGKAAGNSVKARQMNSMLEDIRTALNNHGSVRKAGCNPCYNRVKTLSLPHEAMASITNRIP